jgi:hypothetical protein
MRRKKSTTKAAKLAPKRKERVTLNYIKWFVANQSGDARLAATLAKQWRDGWNLALRRFRQGATSEEVARRLKTEGYNAILLEEGLSRFELPGRTVTFLVLNREKGCQQITLEKWTANVRKTTNVILIGMGRKDVLQTAVAEKQIHLCAFELPREGDYLAISTQSISPLLKGVIVFVGVTLLAGCTKETEKQSTPATPPTPPTPPPLPSDPTGAPGPDNVTSDDSEEVPEEGMALPTGRNGNSKNVFHKKPGFITNVDPKTPIDHWYWFCLYLVRVPKLTKGCCFYLLVNRKLWINGDVHETGWHPDTPFGNNAWVDDKGLHFVDNPGYPPKPPNPPPYDKEAGISAFVKANDHVIITWYFKLVLWCPGQKAREYTFSKTMDIDKGTVKNAFEKPKYAGSRAVNAEDHTNQRCM